ncbi:CRC1 (YOR100C) [Zygosaccharomyces parabailii]|nr:CRC1 (YOR100C) [Zygosaccharomyces parabailii]
MEARLSFPPPLRVYSHLQRPASRPTFEKSSPHNHINNHMSDVETPAVQEEVRTPNSPTHVPAVAIPPTHHRSALRENAESLAAGAVGGVFAVVSGHPFDLLKVRCQNGQAASMSHAVKEILNESHGSIPAAVRGFYRGVIPPLLGVTPIFAVSFWGYDMGKKIVARYSSSSSSGPAALTTAQLATAGFISAIPTTLVMAPTERVKVVLQTTRGGTFISAARHVISEGGLRSLFRGSWATMARDGPGSALYFAAYEATKKLLQRPGQPENEFSVGKTCFAGGMAGVAMWCGVFPIDTVKTRLQAGGSKVSFAQAVREIYRGRGGLRGFFPGLGPALCRSFPANAATFLGVELTHSLLRPKSTNDPLA